MDRVPFCSPIWKDLQIYQKIRSTAYIWSLIAKTYIKPYIGEGGGSIGHMIQYGTCNVVFSFINIRVIQKERTSDIQDTLNVGFIVNL